MKKKGYEAEVAKEYREVNKKIQKAVKKSNRGLDRSQCEEIETCLNKNNIKKTYQLVKDLTSENQSRSSTVQDRSGKCLTEENEILTRWTEYSSDLYNHESCGDNAVLPKRRSTTILQKGAEIAVASLKHELSSDSIARLEWGMQSKVSSFDMKIGSKLPSSVYKDLT